LTPSVPASGRNHAIRATLGVACASFAVAWAPAASAQSPTPDDASSTSTPATPIGISATLSNAVAFREGESTLMTILGGSYAWNPSFSTFARVGALYNASTGLESAVDVANPMLGATAQFEVAKDLVLGGQAGFTVPVGTGGGDAPSAAALRGWLNSIDWGGVMFAPNHFDLFAGARATYTLRRCSFQLESVLYELLRVRGAKADPVGASVTLTGTTATMAYAVLPQLSLSTAISETRVWNTPTYVASNPDSRVDYFFIAGATTTLKVARTDVSWTLLYARALDLPLSGQRFQVAELDLGFSL
jgi:hypothetical protein